jgi:putative membrane protein
VSLSDVPGEWAGDGSGSVRRRTHPLTPLIESVRGLGVLLGLVIVFGGQGLWALAQDIGGLLGLVAALCVVLVVGLLILGLFYLKWTRTEFYFDAAGDFHLDSGVLGRQERRVALSRLQSVDVVRPLLGRIAGLSQVTIELAGSGDSRVALAYLTDAEATRLRAEIIARAAGVDPQAGEAPEAVLATVPTRDLIVSLLLRSETFLLLAISVVVVAAAVLTDGATGLVLLLFTGGVPLLGVFGQFSRFFSFTVAESPDGLRLRHGLASVQSQTVPPGRVQAVEVSQPLLWRRRDWVRVSLNVAGRAGDGEQTQTEHVLLPVAPSAVALSILERVLPGVDLAGMAFDPAPRAARWRAPLQHELLGVSADERIFAVRRGFLTRRTGVIPHARTQSVQVSQGPWQRRLGLASVEVHSTPGPVRILGLHRAARQAREIAEDQLVRAARARADGPAERWMRSRSPGGAPVLQEPGAPAGARPAAAPGPPRPADQDGAG